MTIFEIAGISVLFLVVNIIVVMYFAKRYFRIEYSKPDKVFVPASKVTTDIKEREELKKEVSKLNEGIAKILDEISKSTSLTEDIGKKILTKLEQIEKKGSLVYASNVEEDKEEFEKEKEVERETQEEKNADVVEEVKEEEPKMDMKSTETFKFKTEYILKNKKYFSEQELELIDEVLNLLDKEGSVSSVVSYQNDEETKYLKNWKSDGGLTTYDIVKNASLREHTFNVVEILIGNARKKLGKYFEASLPKFIIAGLLHDIGKLPSLREEFKSYSKSMHPKLSGEYARQLFRKYKISEDFANEVIEAVENHHKKGKIEENLLGMLKDADYKAREKELLTYGDKISSTAHEFSYDEKKNLFKKEFLRALMENIYPYINTKKKFRGRNLIHVFLFDGYIYADPELLLRVMVDDSRYKLPDFFYEEDSENKSKAKMAITNTFREYDYLRGDIKSDYFSASYNIKIKGQTLKNQRRVAFSEDVLDLIGVRVEDVPSLPNEFKVERVYLYKKEDKE